VRINGATASNTTEIPFNVLVDHAVLDMDDTADFTAIGPGATVDMRGAAASFEDAGNNRLDSLATVKGTLLVSDGYTLTPAGGTLALEPGGTVGGHGGTINGNVTAAGGGGVYSPGLSIGELDVGGDAEWAGGGTYPFQVHDFAGLPGDPAGWDLLDVAGSIGITADSASRFTVAVESLDALGEPGPAANFDPGSALSILIARAGDSIIGFDPGSFLIDAASFQNDLQGGSFGIDSLNNGIYLTFTPAVTGIIPEPSTLLIWSLLAGAGIVAGWRRRR
jgi:hypothetical protein